MNTSNKENIKKCLVSRPILKVRDQDRDRQQKTETKTGVETFITDVNDGCCSSKADVSVLLRGLSLS